MSPYARIRFGAEVARIRRAMVPAVTARGFAVSCGLTLATLEKIERGRPSWKPNAEQIAAIAIVTACSTEVRRGLFRLAGLVDPALIKAWAMMPESARAAARAALYDGVARAGAGMLGESEAVQEACLLAVEILTTAEGGV